MRVPDDQNRIVAVGSSRHLAGVAGSHHDGAGAAGSSEDLAGVAGSRHDGAGAAGSSEDLAGADQLISDLAALLEAGLVVVHEHVLGPARYGVAPIADHREERQQRVRSRQPAMIGGAVLD
jgi:hypothetical protein